MLARALVTLTLIGLLQLPAARAGEPPSTSAFDADQKRIVVDALSATGCSEPTCLEPARREIEDAIASIVARMGDGPPSYRRAAKLHRMLHARYLRDYRSDADGLQDIVRKGEFNCVSATLLFGIVARRLGYDVVVLEHPGHLLLGLEIDGRTVEVETTSPRGFDRLRRAGPDDPARSAGYHATARLDGLRGRGREEASSASTYWQVPLDSAVGFAWLNAAWRSLDSDAPTRAAEQVAVAARMFPDLSTQGENMMRLLARAFSEEYESGAFEQAERIAVIGVELFPASTTSRDRLFAAGIKRVEDTCDDDDPQAAASIVRSTVERVGSGRDVTRFERRAWPLVVAASVRTGDWSLAREGADAYAEVEPDAVESRRVIDWVSERRKQASSPSVGPSSAAPSRP